MPVLKGIVHGKTIELAEEPGLPDGQAVSVLVNPLLAPGEGLRRSAGSWSDGGEELDAWLAEMRRSRQMDRGAPQRVSFLLDTDTCSAHLKGTREVTGRCMQHAGQLRMSTVSLAELYTWALRSNASPKQLLGLGELLSDVVVLDVTPAVAEQFGRTRAALLDQGRPVPGMDLLIAATALVHDLALVTHNTQDFDDIPDLRLLDWIPG